jgi:hypothetical protein
VILFLVFIVLLVVAFCPGRYRYDVYPHDVYRHDVGVPRTPMTPQDTADRITRCLLGSTILRGPARGQMVNRVTVDIDSIITKNGVTIADAEVTYTDGTTHLIAFNTNGNEWVWTQKV